jgi:membrane-associated phospholipid phosphatase
MLAPSIMSVDHMILRFVNSFAHTSLKFDTTMVIFSQNQFVKGAVVMLFCWAWFRTVACQDLHRRILLAGLASPFAAFLVGRALTRVLPYRNRPLLDAALHWRPPYDPTSAWTHHWPREWSSFPSDHAALFAALAMTLFLVSRPAGLLALLYSLLFIDFPRVYLGLHYPSDILGGIIVGFTVAWIATLAPIREAVSPPLLRFLERRPGTFYASFFLALFALGSVDAVFGLVYLTRTIAGVTSIPR